MQVGGHGVLLNREVRVCVRVYPGDEEKHNAAFLLNIDVDTHCFVGFAPGN